MSKFTAFDRIVGAFAMLIMLLIAMIASLGDRVGAEIVSIGPGGKVPRNSAIRIEFGEEMNRDSVERRLVVTPQFTGSAVWSGNTLIYKPSESLPAGRSYTVRLAAGAQATSGRKTLGEALASFTTYDGGVVYLAPASATPRNIVVADPNDPTSARQLTDSKTGVVSFDVSPDGSRIAYAELAENRATSSIKLLDVATGQSRVLVSCGDSDCTNPRWRPNGWQLVYERLDYYAATGGGLPRIWLIELNAERSSTRPYFSDMQVPPATRPHWSPDGGKLALSKVRYLNSRFGARPTSTAPTGQLAAGESPAFDERPGIIVCDLNFNDFTFIPTVRDTEGIFSPDGERLLFWDAVTEGSLTRTLLHIVDLRTRRTSILGAGGIAFDDGPAAWSADGSWLVVERSYKAENAGTSRQLYRVAPSSGSFAPLIVDEGYENLAFTWDRAGKRLAVEREALEGGASPAIWLYDLATGSLAQFAADAFSPAWLP